MAICCWCRLEETGGSEKNIFNRMYGMWVVVRLLSESTHQSPDIKET